MKLFLIGLALNFIVMVGNSGKMPVFPDGITGIKIELILKFNCLIGNPTLNMRLQTGIQNLFI